MTFCEECKYIKDCELAKHEEVDTCKKGEKLIDYDTFVHNFIAEQLK